MPIVPGRAARLQDSRIDLSPDLPIPIMSSPGVPAPITLMGTEPSGDGGSVILSPVPGVNMHRQSLKHSVIEKFAEGSGRHPADELERVTELENTSPQILRFMKMVGVRKQQMLEKILFDEP